jgi:hypothetical protein
MIIADEDEKDEGRDYFDESTHEPEDGDDEPWALAAEKDVSVFVCMCVGCMGVGVFVRNRELKGDATRSSSSNH